MPIPSTRRHPMCRNMGCRKMKWLIKYDPKRHMRYDPDLLPRTGHRYKPAKPAHDAVWWPNVISVIAIAGFFFLTFIWS